MDEDKTWGEKVAEKVFGKELVKEKVVATKEVVTIPGIAGIRYRHKRDSKLIWEGEVRLDEKEIYADRAELLEIIDEKLLPQLHRVEVMFRTGQPSERALRAVAQQAENLLHELLGGEIGGE